VSRVLDVRTRLTYYQFLEGKNANRFERGLQFSAILVSRPSSSAGSWSRIGRMISSDSADKAKLYTPGREVQS
jgi:hypothetical protein